MDLGVPFLIRVSWSLCVCDFVCVCGYAFSVSALGLEYGVGLLLAGC